MLILLLTSSIENQDGGSCRHFAEVRFQELHTLRNEISTLEMHENLLTSTSEIGTQFSRPGLRPRNDTE